LEWHSPTNSGKKQKKGPGKAGPFFKKDSLALTGGTLTTLNLAMDIGVQHYGTNIPPLSENCKGKFPGFQTGFQIIKC
jgi:hypothetical protein